MVRTLLLEFETASSLMVWAAVVSGACQLQRVILFLVGSGHCCLMLLVAEKPIELGEDKLAALGEDEEVLLDLVKHDVFESH